MVSRETPPYLDTRANHSSRGRQFILLPSNSFEESRKYICDKYQLQKITSIDTTRDFNQNKWLGKELNNTLIYINHRTPINAILSITGCVLGGCLLVLAYDKNDTYDYFKQHILFPQLTKLKPNPKEIIDEIELPALDELKKDHRITHLIGERGTGKSALLGHYIASLITSSVESRIILCSPSRQSSANTLKLIGNNVSRETFRFLAPSELHKHLSHCDILILDEAASIQQNLLKLASQTHNIRKIIFATTIDGYEGTGQSYRLNFLQGLENGRVIELTRPKRFSPNDPLYCFAKQLYHPQTTQETIAEDDGYYLLNHINLREKRLTRTIFSLLRDAHYRSTPNDLANFYNNPATFALAVKNRQVIGAVHATSEALSPTIPPIDIINGTRRPKNAMTQQAILQAYRQEAITKSKILRISRIAITQTHRRQQHASTLIKTITDFAISNNYDFISTSFSGNQQSLRFWLSQAFIPVRVGLQKNKWNDEFAILMLKPLTPHSKELSQILFAHFKHHLNHFYSYYSSQAPEISQLLAASSTTACKTHSTTSPRHLQRLLADLNSVIDYHRDIHWLLPTLSLYELPKSAEKLANQLLSIDFIEKKDKKKVSQQLIQLRHLIKKNV